ncbi:aminoglycoside phosphotransferase family protein [Streptomyces sp. NPDC057638]|uniref:aminoglycoside phosphotransferase family protein n=1 Tax=Streptomyces sp. NPDC057638 TaxID=3346190 RepID=UPI0036B425BA
MTTSTPLHIPEAFAASHTSGGDPLARAWIEGLPTLARDLLDRWELSPDGPSAHGMAALVLPVLRADGEPAVLRLQRVTDESEGVPLGLRAWDGAGIVRLLDHDPGSGAQLLERLDARRPLSSLTDDDEIMGILAGVMARLVSVPAPEGLRRLATVAAAMVEQSPGAVGALRHPAERDLVRRCAGVVAELTGEAGDRLLHWDLHYDNVLAAGREPWLAIDPEPLAGDPGFELLPALDNRWDEAVATGDVRGTVLRRFDRLTEALGLERDRAVGWTLGRVLQNALWDIEDGKDVLEPAQVAIAGILTGR